jgi:hypothetical protein
MSNWNREHNNTLIGNTIGSIINNVVLKPKSKPENITGMKIVSPCQLLKKRRPKSSMRK